MSATERSESRSDAAYNAIFRKIFRYAYWESVTNLQHVLGRLTWEELTEKRQTKFMSQCRLFDENTLVRVLSRMFSQ